MSNGKEDELRSALESRYRVAATGGKDVFAKAWAFDQAGIARDMGLYPFFCPVDANEGPEALVEGKRVLMFGSNNYLGLTRDPRVREAAQRAIVDFGTSLTGSRLLNGTLELHRQLERRLASFLGKEACLVVTTGYQANLALIQSLVNKQAVLVLDHRSHASLFDAAKLIEGEAYTFRHGDPDHLAHVLANIKGDRGVLVALEGVFSMDGDVVELPSFLDVADRYGARVVLDDAHGVGVHGRGGRGTASLFDADERVDVVVGTFSKALASIGGFIAGPSQVIDYVQHFGRSFVFTASLPPASLAAASAALEVIEAEPQLVEQLQRKVELYRRLLVRAGFRVTRGTTPIVPIVIGGEVETVRMWRELLDHGLYVNAALVPAVPRGRALLRTSVMATHEDEHIERAVEILTAAAHRYGVLGHDAP